MHETSQAAQFFAEVEVTKGGKATYVVPKRADRDPGAGSALKSCGLHDRKRFLPKT